MRWLCLGTLQFHHARQGLHVQSDFNSDFETSVEYNGLGAHSYGLKLIGEEVQEMRLVPFSGFPLAHKLWGLLLQAENSRPHLKANRLRKGFEKVLDRIRKDDFDVVFTREIWDYSLEFLQGLAQEIPNRVVWLSSSPGRAPFPEIWEKLRCFTHIFLIDRKGVELLRERGLPAFYLPFALADYSEVRISAEQPISLGFLGTLYPPRLELLESLIDLGLKFWAPNFTASTRIICPPLTPCYQGEAWGMNLLLNMASCRLLVNPVHRSYMRGQSDDVTNFRLFEAIGAGSFQIAERNSAIEEIFDSGEVETYLGTDELKDKVSFYLKKPDFCRKQVEKTLKKVESGHLYSHRMREILKIVSGKPSSF
jgi:hypothetical protein